MQSSNVSEGAAGSAPGNTAPIFVVGPPRSGTTLTATILGRHSRVFMAGENHFFEDIYSRRDALGDLAEPAARQRTVERLSTIYGRHNQLDDQQRVERLFADRAVVLELESQSTHADMLARFMHVQCPQKPRWGNNTPKDIFHIEEILALYPDATVLVCVRDVRDFLLSYKNRWRTTNVENRERFKSLYHPIVTSLVWRATMSRIPAVRAAVPAGRFMIVRYEELVSDAEVVVRSICDVIGESFEPDMLNVATHNSSSDKQEVGIFSSSVGGWREKLAGEDAWLARWLNRKHLRDLGYPLENPVRARLSRVLLRCLSFPVALVRALRVNASQRGPLVPYLCKRVKALFSRS